MIKMVRKLVKINNNIMNNKYKMAITKIKCQKARLNINRKI